MSLFSKYKTAGGPRFYPHGGNASTHRPIHGALSCRPHRTRKGLVFIVNPWMDTGGKFHTCKFYISNWMIAVNVWFFSEKLSQVDWDSVSLKAFEK